MLDFTKSFIETQFPISKTSKESYRERKAGSEQILTCLGKWWGRKPLVLVRATVLGCLLPVSEDLSKDRDVFLELMGMSKRMLLKRKITNLSPKEVFDALAEPDRSSSFSPEGKWLAGVSAEARKRLQDKAFENLSYDDKLKYCVRPDLMDDSLIDWDMISEYLHTSVDSYNSLISYLSEKRYGHKVKVGDCFVGGGSNVFEPARLGCDVYGSDLNPMASALTWSALNLIGGTKENTEKCQAFLDKVFDRTCEEIDALGIERNEQGEIAKYYLYCNEVVCPECGHRVPLLPTFLVSDKYSTVVSLNPNKDSFDFDVRMDSSRNEVAYAKSNGTVMNGNLVCPHCHKSTSINAIRGGDGSPNLRLWGKHDWRPAESDVLQGRLYAIKYIKESDLTRTEAFRRKPGPVTDATFGTTHYSAPTSADLEREKIVEDYLEAHFDEWQWKGYIPSMEIEEGYNTSQIIREKGWKYWHQLFNPRQLLILGLLVKNTYEMAKEPNEIAASISGLNRTLDNQSELCRWSTTGDKVNNVFYNQALNTLNNWGCRSSYSFFELWETAWKSLPISCEKTIDLLDARIISEDCDLWITDPPYADAVNYHELSEYFLSWDASLIKKAFPEWYTDSRRALAVNGTGESFNKSMIAIYRNLANHMPDNGMQVVMFTHQDPRVWAELAMVLWSAGLQVTAAWCISTETDAVGLKQGNYVQGTVLLCLRKRKDKGIVFQDELYEQIRTEVENQIDSMRSHDRLDDPDFNDSDYLLAAYAAALKVLTSYSDIDGIDVEYELTQARDSGKDSPVTQIINTAKKEAYDYLVPTGISGSVWRQMSPSERFYIKGFELGLNGCFASGTFQELARSFGVQDYKEMLGSTKANTVRVKTPSEYKNALPSDDPFSETPIRHVLLALHLSLEAENAQEGRKYLRGHYDTNNDYWTLRRQFMAILDFLQRASGDAYLPMWQDASSMAVNLKLAIENDSI